MSLSEQALRVVDVDPGDERATTSAFLRFLLAEAAVHAWVTALDGSGRGFEDLLLVCAVVLSGCALFAFMARPPRVVVALAFTTMIARLTVAFPHLYNHLFLEALLMGAAVILPGEDEDDAVFLQFTRATIVIVLFWSGVQKVLHGCYFEGEFLAVSIASNEYFAMPFTWIAPAEVARLRDLLPLRIGAGPFRLESLPLVALSNLVWVAEIALPIGLLVRRTRALAVVATLALLVAIESAARELVFGLLFSGGVLLFAPGRVFARALPWSVAALGALLAIELLFPDVWLN